MQCYYHTHNCIVTFILCYTLLKTLEKEIEIAIKWFGENEFIVNPSKFQVIRVNRSNESDALYTLNINN